MSTPAFTADYDAAFLCSLPRRVAAVTGRQAGAECNCYAAFVMGAAILRRHIAAIYRDIAPLRQIICGATRFREARADVTPDAFCFCCCSAFIYIHVTHGYDDHGHHGRSKLSRALSAAVTPQHDVV